MSIDATTLRHFLHILGAAVWVGGQITMAGLLPAIRRAEEDVRKGLARQFNRVAWPFFGVAFVTGLWNVMERDPGDASNGWNAALMIKLLLVAASGVAAWMHTRATARSAIAMWGAVGGTAALGSLLFGSILLTNA